MLDMINRSDEIKIITLNIFSGFINFLNFILIIIPYVKWYTI
jgi:hypothetical protein